MNNFVLVCGLVTVNTDVNKAKYRNTIDSDDWY